MQPIFISYRRSDSQDVTGRIYDRLLGKFTQKQIFKDVDSIPLGVSFPTHIRQVLSKSGVVLVIIGPSWLTATDEKGQRRLNDPNDFVRLEVELALRATMPVIPVLVSNAAMPQASELPPSLKALVSRNGITVRPDPDFNNDIGRLFSGLERLQELLNTQSARRDKRSKQEIPVAVPVTEPDPKIVPAQPASADLAVRGEAENKKGIGQETIVPAALKPDTISDRGTPVGWCAGLPICGHAPPARRKMATRTLALSASRALSSVAVVSIILGGLALLCGVWLGSALLDAIEDARHGGLYFGPPLVIIAILWLVIVWWGTSAVVGGIGLLKRRPWGRVLVYIASSAAAAVGLLIGAVGILRAQNISALSDYAFVSILVVTAVILLSYALFSYLALAKARIGEDQELAATDQT